jgi:hypothetical protein
VAGRVDEGPAGESRIEDQVQAHEAIDLAPAPRAPARAEGADHAPARAGTVAEGQDHVADAQRAVVAARRRRAVEIGRYFQDGQVGT